MTVLAQGVIQQNHISALSNPSMAAVLEHIVGHWGAVLVNIGLIISVLGAWLGWTLLAGELPFIVAKDGLFPKWFAKENQNKAPSHSLLITNILVQIFLISMLFTQSAYQFAFSLASSAILIPYTLSALLPSEVYRSNETACDNKAMADWYHRIDLYNLARLCSWIRLFTINHVALCTWTGRLYDRTKKQSKTFKTNRLYLFHAYFIISDYRHRQTTHWCHRCILMRSDFYA